MTEEVDHEKVVEKISHFDLVEILVNEKQDMLFDGIIDPVYIKMHYDRVVNTSKSFDNVKLIGHHGNRSKELIVEVFVSR